jgi:hypothetical protein
MKIMKQKNYLAIGAFVLLAMLIIGGCGGTQRTVKRTDYVQAQQQDSVQDDECASESDNCVAEMKDGDVTGDYLKIGEVREGEVFEMDFDQSDKLESVCADGLAAVSYTLVVNDECAWAACPCYVCVECPDGTCGELENKCNCPQDCK